jgi:RHH-type proline utilization regulon transcriptional repressor/proline dehydrogenase/delta 1-pyrroline-5-carboxylate dehydrogenase
MGLFSKRSQPAQVQTVVVARQPAADAAPNSSNGPASITSSPASSTTRQDPLEPATRAVGEQLLALARGHKSGLLSSKFYSDWLMEWSMKDPNFKVQMFRFVDAFPVLRTTDDTFDLLKEYLSQPGVTVPGPIAAGIKAGGLAKGLFVATMSKQIESMAGKFIAGTDAKSALPNLKSLWSDGIAFSVDLLGEACVSDDEADAYQRKYLDLINNLPADVAAWKPDPRLESDHLGPIPRTNVSIKISSLSARCDPIDSAGATNDLLKRLLPILEAAKAKGVFVNFDMEQAAFKDFTLDLFQTCRERVDFDGGLAMQAYLVSGPDDARRIVDWARKANRRVTVRLVKGAYWDYETINAEARGWPCPVWPTKPETDACFERMARIFLDATPKAPGQPGVCLALGSHNARSIAATVAYADSLGLPRNAIELQMLHGMADQLKHAAAEMGLRVREYVPVGEMIPGMAYLVRRLLENTSNESWLKAGFLDNADTAALLADPRDLIRRRAASRGPAPLNSGPTTGDANTIRTAEPSATNLERAPERHALTPSIDLGDTKLRPFYNEPFRDFAIAATRDAFAAAVARAAVPAVAQSATADTARDMVARAHATFPAWRDVPARIRAAALLKAAALMRARRDELSAIMIKEAGKTWREADADTCEAIDFCEFYARLAVPLFDRTRIGRFIGELDESTHEPRGVAAVISPWNFPLAICCGMAVAALVTGNTTVVKPAEQTAGIAKALVDILHLALRDTLPSGSPDPASILQLCAGPGETAGAALVRDPRVALIAFTGSRDVGCDILNAAAPASPFSSDRAAFNVWAQSNNAHLKHVICEMGGKNAAIIDTSADPDEAVLAIRHSAFGFQGQKCSALSRLIVVDREGPDGPAIAAFRHRLVEATKALTVGDPTRPGTDIGPVIDADAKAKIDGYIARAKASGLRFAELPVPNGLEAATGRHFVAPHIFWTVPADHELARDEIFGPVLAIIHAKSFDHALEIANASPYKLTGGIYSRSPLNIERAKREFRVGNLYINRGITGALVARHPFGGFGMSGAGSKAGGLDYLLHFVLPRALAENTMRRGFAPDI